MPGQDLQQPQNPLGVESIGKLLPKYAIPSIISLLVGSIYNIVDQIFIGQGVGTLGNAATNVAFPLTTFSIAVALLFGIGGSALYNLLLGQKRQEEAARVYAHAILFLVITGVLLCVISLLFLEPLMKAFGATKANLPYCLSYTGITAIGLPASILSMGGSHLIRADGSPKYSMFCITIGAIINTVLDPIFMFVLFPEDMRMQGAALATILGQFVSAVLMLLYFVRKVRNVTLTRTCFQVKRAVVGTIVSLGLASFFNQMAMATAQITMNNVLKHYGGLSPYGEDIPLACVAVIIKVNTVLMSFIIGIAQGCQPIISFSYGAKRYSRVQKTYRTGLLLATLCSVVGFLCFQIFPEQIISLFGDDGENSALYYHFAVRYFRIFMLLTFANAVQPMTSNFFTAIGKARMGILISLTRQVLFLIPLILLFPLLWGIDGVMYAGPIADGASVVLALLLVTRELRRISRLETLEGPVTL